MRYIKKIIAVLIFSVLVLSVSAFAETLPENGENTDGYSEASGADADSGMDIMQNTSSEANAGTSGTDSGIIGGTSQAESGEEYVVIGKIEKRNNEISDFMTTAGIVLMILGVAGIVCVIVWNISSKKAVKSAEEEAYRAVGMAAAENRADSYVPMDEEEYFEEPAELITPGQHFRDEPPQQVQPQQEFSDYEETAAKAQSPAQRKQTTPPQPQARPVQRQPQAAAQNQPVQRQQPSPQVRHPQRQGAQSKSIYDTDEILREVLKDLDK